MWIPFYHHSYAQMFIPTDKNVKLTSQPVFIIN